MLISRETRLIPPAEFEALYDQSQRVAIEVAGLQVIRPPMNPGGSGVISP
jgi:hypothetical protein